MSKGNTTRIGIVGLGGMGRTHANNIEEAGHDVVAGADVVPEVRESFAEQFDVPTYEGHEEMYDEEDLDGIVITTPNKFHEPAAVSALERDINVLCEKPPAHNVEAAERMVEAERESNAFGMIGFQSRFGLSAKLFKEHDEKGRFGDIRHAEVRSIRRRGIPGMGSWFTNKELSGGGALIDIGVHSLDLILHLLDFPEISEVTATTRADFGTQDDYVDPDGWAGHWDTSKGGFDVEDSASAFIRCADGTTIAFEVAWAANRKPPEDNMVIWGTDAGATFTDDGIEVYETDDTGKDHYVDLELRGNQRESPQYLKDEAFVEAIVDDEPPTINTFEQGLTVQRVMDAIYRSSEEQRAVRLD